MRNYLIVCCLALAYMLTGCGQNESDIDSYFGFGIPQEELDAYLDEKMDQLDIPGMSIVFVNDGEVVYHRVKGFANREDSLPVTKETIFEAASISKSIFAHFVMQYVEEGKLDLDQPLYTYLPYPDIAHDERYKQITARMVLCHRTGFPNWRSDHPENKLFLKFDPGTDFNYSGEGYQYLAKVLKQIEETDWEGLEAKFQEKVGQPFGLQHTVFIQDAYAMAHKAEAYDKQGVWISPERDRDSMVRYQFVAPASIHTESLDFSKWMIAMMNKEGLSPEGFQEMWKVHTFVEEINDISIDYTLGFFKPRLPFTDVYLHGGNNYGFTCWFAMDPEKDWGYALFTNSEYGEQLGAELLLYSMVGPNESKALVIVGMGLLVFLSLLFLLIRSAIRRGKKRGP
ncbi:MAG: serine hydrolase domain-containing protein [Bacteroidota bacterium]